MTAGGYLAEGSCVPFASQGCRKPESHDSS